MNTCLHPHTPNHGFFPEGQTGWLCMSCVAHTPALSADPASVLATVARLENIPESWICAKTRSARIVRVRFIFYGALRRTCFTSNADMSRALGVDQSMGSYNVLRAQAWQETVDAVVAIYMAPRTPAPPPPVPSVQCVIRDLPISTTDRAHVAHYIHDVLLAGAPMNAASYLGLRLLAQDVAARRTIVASLVRPANTSVGRSYWRDTIEGVTGRIELQCRLYVGRAA